MRLRLSVLAALVGAALVLGACASDDLAGDASSTDAGGVTVRISGQNFAEARLVASMYAQLLEHHGYRAEVKLVDTRDAYMATFPGTVDVVPEYVGGIVDFLNARANGADAEPLATHSAPRSIDAGSALLVSAGITLLTPSAATDTNAFFVTQEYAEAEGLATLSDLSGRSVVLAAAPDCEGRPDCEGGLSLVYGIDVTEILGLGFASDATYRSVLEGESQLGLTSTTDGTLASQGLVLLADDREIQPAQNLVPAVATAFLEEHPDVQQPLESLMAALTTEKLTELNGRVSVDREEPEDVARSFLTDAGLI